MIAYRKRFVTMASKSNTKTNKKTNTKTNKNTSGRSRSKKSQKSSAGVAEELILILVFAVAVLMLLGNFNLCGAVGVVLQKTTFGLFGALGYVSPLLWMVIACYWVSNPRNTYLKLKLLMGVFLFICCCGICQLICMKTYVPDQGMGDYFAASLEHKNGGGFFGGGMVMMLYPLFSRIGTWLVLLVLIAVLVLVITEFSLLDFLQFHAANFKDSYQENREIRELKNEQNRRRREEQLAQNRQRNGEKMLQARKDLELMKRAQVAAQGMDQKEKQAAKQEEPIHQPVSKTEPAPKEQITPDAEPVKKNRGKNGRIPSFLMDDLPQEPAQEPLEDIISRELSRTREQESRQMASEPLQPVPEEIAPAETSAAVEPPKYDDRGMPVRKKRTIESQEDRVIETAGGRAILVEPGTAGTKKVEAEGHESDPHGTGQHYKDEEPDQSAAQKPQEQEREYVFPPVNLLSRGTGGTRQNIDKELKETAIKLQQTLQNFGVRVNITNVSCGPAVTRYELQPEMGVKVSKIVALQDDIKLNLAAADIRIEAPIPGKAAIGIEVPNKENVAVNLRDLIEDESFRKHKSKLAFATGKDIGGQNIIGDIAKMPHLLIAGATGSGKSVCINTIIVSILYHAKPSEVKLIMIDPKVVELSVYNGIPHLLKPVVTDPKQAAGALAWAVSEMTDRYKRFAELGVRDISGYNEKIKEHFKGREDEMPKAMPQIVIIVDELADLMMVAPGEVEDSILHLAQMARAAGMHLILATQRPSVNVITGVIKANIPSRIAFAVSSGVDSRTILDMVGAEKLLGKGDMLYYPTGLQKPIRVQGAFVSDKEVSAVVEFLTNQGQVEGGGYDNHIDLAAVAAMTDAKSQMPAAPGEDGRDPLFKEAGNLIVTTEKASIGMLQRKFRIGFNRAARIMDQLSESGVVGPEEGTKARAVLMSEEQFEAYCSAEGL
jgi:S-DNA-T family DNA segregation ATPase FtsK/SpoIIIE